MPQDTLLHVLQHGAPNAMTSASFCLCRYEPCGKDSQLNHRQTQQIQLHFTTLQLPQVNLNDMHVSDSLSLKSLLGCFVVGLGMDGGKAQHLTILSIFST